MSYGATMAENVTVQPNILPLIISPTSETADFDIISIV